MSGIPALLKKRRYLFQTIVFWKVNYESVSICLLLRIFQKFIKSGKWKLLICYEWVSFHGRTATKRTFLMDLTNFESSSVRASKTIPESETVKLHKLKQLHRYRLTFVQCREKTINLLIVRSALKVHKVSVGIDYPTRAFSKTCLFLLSVLLDLNLMLLQ